MEENDREKEEETERERERERNYYLQGGKNRNPIIKEIIAHTYTSKLYVTYNCTHTHTYIHIYTEIERVKECIPGSDYSEQTNFQSRRFVVNNLIHFNSN